jgi:tripartite-type tricarboxylate transporter receptor subunit TctC
MPRVIAWAPALLLAALATFTAPAYAQRPSPLTLLVGFAPGSGTDVASRLIADHLSETIGRPVVVVNRPGAGGRVAAKQLKHARPDGSTLLVTPLFAIVLAPLISQGLDYDPQADFVPVTQLFRFEFGLAVAANHPARNVQEFIGWSRTDPSKANFGTLAAGSLAHFTGFLLGEHAGVDMVHVAYNGPGALEADLLGGQVSSAIDAIPNFSTLQQSGKLRILATTGATRSRLCPEVPTFAELGLPAIRADSWVGVYAPARTPRAVVDTLSREINAALRAPDVQAHFNVSGFEATGTTPDELAAIMAADTARWAPIVKATGFHAN